jgi:hypothetical protein
VAVGGVSTHCLSPKAENYMAWRCFLKPLAAISVGAAFMYTFQNNLPTWW